MEKTYILYREIIVGDDLMECIYFSNGSCVAQPVERKVAPYLRPPLYQPTEEEQKVFCKDGFRGCTRYVAYQEHLKAIGLAKETETEGPTSG